MKTRIAIGLLALWMVGCKQTPPVLEDKGSPLPEPIAKIMETKCATYGCHSGASDNQLRLHSWEQVMAGSANVGSVVVPYNYNWSHLFQHVNSFSDLGLTTSEDNRMPPAPLPVLSKDEVITIQNWIKEGAKSASGEYYWQKQEQSHTNKLFVLCSGSDLVAVTDMATNRIMRYISVGKLEGVTEAPHYILVSPDKKYFYVSLIQGNLIEKYSTENYQLLGRLQVAGNPSLLVCNAAGNRLAVSHFNDDVSIPKLTLIDTDNMTVLEQVTDDVPFAHGLVATQDFRTIYLTANHGNFFVRYKLNADGSSIQDSEKFPIEPSEPNLSGSLKYYPYQIVMPANEDKLFIACSNSHEVRVYSTSDLSLLQRISTDSLPRLLTYDAVSNKVFVACAKAKNTALQGSIRGCVGVINAGTLTLEQNIYNVGQRPHGVGIDTKGRKLYVSSENAGGIDPPHHPTQGTLYPPGKYNVIDLNTLTLLPEMQTDIAEFPTSLSISN